MNPLRALSASAERRLFNLQQIAQSLTSSAELGTEYRVTRPHPLLICVRHEELFCLLAPAAVWDHGRELLKPFLPQLAASQARLLLLGAPERRDWTRAAEFGVGAVLPAEPNGDELYAALRSAFELLELKARSEQGLSRYRYEFGELIEIARALTTEREIDKLLGLILEKARFVTTADAGSLYVVEGEAEQMSQRQLHFMLSQNDSVSFDSREFWMPISARSMAGYVALEQKTLSIADVYAMPAVAPFAFDRSFDVKIGYRTKSMLVIPLSSSKGEVIGVLQLLNKKRDAQQRLLSAGDVENFVVAFDERSEQLATTLAAQAGIALENALLYEEIRNIFEGFVRASVDAIEARDPTTSGHSRRVADVTVRLALAVERASTGPYADVSFRREDLRELEWASLLHDFGKIGVREHVLVKANKLYPQRLELVRQRFDFVARTVEADVLSRKLAAIARGAPDSEVLALDNELRERLAELEEYFTVILQANEPTVLASGNFQRIEELGRRTYARLDGQVAALLAPEEVRALSVLRGSLTADEYEEIRSHVVHTYRFLSQIPWGRTFSRVAEIAGAHHERLNGTGYPNKLTAEQIPIQSKMMSISDIFDALTAADRPYKRAVPPQRALDILGLEVKDGHVDGELVRIFAEARVWES